MLTGGSTPVKSKIRFVVVINKSSPTPLTPSVAPAKIPSTSLFDNIDFHIIALD